MDLGWKGLIPLGLGWLLLLAAMSAADAEGWNVAGRIGIKMLPVLQRTYLQMCEPKWVISMGACASTGGVFDAYATVQGCDQFIPVDVYVPGCPPRPEQLIEGVMAIQRIVDQDGIPPKGPDGKRIPLGLVVEPTHDVKPQPVAVGLR